MASPRVSGQIEKIDKFDGKFGPMYSLTVGGERYGTGKNTMGASAGEWVEFTYTTNAKGYKDVEKGSLKPVEAPAGKSEPVAATKQAVTSYVDSRQDSIVFQSSRKDALHFVDIAVGAGMIDFGKAKGADKLAILETYVDKYTEHFIDECKQNKTHSSQDEPTSIGDVKNDFDDQELPF